MMAAALWLVAAPISFAQAQQPETGARQQPIPYVDPARLESARAVMKAIKLDEQFGAMLPVLTREVTGALVPMLERRQLSAQKKADFQGFLEKMTAEMEKQFAAKMPELINLTALVYARIFNDEQLSALATFYNSQAGQKFVSAAPQAMAEKAPLIIDLMRGEPVEIDRNVDPAALAAARDMLKASKSERTLDAIMAQVGKSPLPSRGGEADPKATEPVQQMVDTLPNIFTTRRPEMMDIIATTWAERFTIDEMKAVTAFYRTPVGESIIDAMPALFAEQQKLTESFDQGLLADMGPKIMQMMPKWPGAQP
jgi:hypothetical protein